MRHDLEKQGYRFAGAHSAVKVCEWCRNSLRGTGFCYKQKFYGIESHRCMQLSPAVFSCTENCTFCWRTFDYKRPEKQEMIDKPHEIIENSVKEHRKLLEGFWSSGDKRKCLEAAMPRHVAISLAGEPCLYSLLPQLIEEVHKRKMTSFLVTNGTVPEMTEKLLNSQPTQMYITLAAPDKKIFESACKPLLPDAWLRLQQSLSVLNQFKRSVIRLTLARNLNLAKPEKYAEIIERSMPNFVEVKAFMSVGGARKRLPYEAMPMHSEIKEFAEQLEKNSSYRIRDEKSDSRVVLLAR